MTWKDICMVLIGFGNGVGVGTAEVAFIVAIGIFPRLAQFSKTDYLMCFYETAATCGAVFITLVTILEISIPVPQIVMGVWGAFHGIFVGMLAAALAEVINIIPVLTRRMRMEEQVHAILIAIALGKITGSLIYWMVPGFY